jgi:hypothetical protein
LRSKPRKVRINKSRLISLKVETTDFAFDIDGHAKEPLATDQLLDQLGPIFAEVGPNPGLAKLLAHLSADAAPLDLSAYTFDGHLDLHTCDPAIGGWLCSGWVTRPWADPDTAVTAIARHGDFERRGELTAAFYDRPDVRGRGVGCVLFMPETSVGKELEQPLSSLEIDTRTSRLRLRGNGQGAVALRQLMATIDLRLVEAPEGTQRARLKSALLRYEGRTEEFVQNVEGHIDFFGYCGAAEGWLFCGWISSAWEDEKAPIIVAYFVDGDISSDVVATFYRRDDLDDRGVGMVVLLRFSIDNRQGLLSLEFEFADAKATIFASGRPPYSESELLDALSPLLRYAELTPKRSGLRTLLLGEEEATRRPAEIALPKTRMLGGHIDFYGHHTEAETWFFCGWVPQPWGDSDKPSRVTARFENGSVSSETTLATFYYREDIEERGVGFILAMAAQEDHRNHLISLELTFAAFSATLETTAAGPGLPARELIEWLSPLLAGGEANSNRSRLQAMLLPEKAEARRQTAPQGYVDIYGLSHDGRRLAFLRLGIERGLRNIGNHGSYRAV